MERLHITEDKREIRDFSKLHLVTSFIRKTLCENASSPLENFLKRRDVIKYDEK